jgi:hypothetical protein
MPITPFLHDSHFKFDTEAKRVMGVAFEIARVALGLVDRDPISEEIVAKQIIELAKAGERNPDLLCEAVLKEFRDQTGELSGAPVSFAKRSPLAT